MDNTEGNHSVVQPWEVEGAGQPPDYNQFKCPKCERSFKSAIAVRMHDMRKHTAGGGNGYRWRQKASRASQLERRRLYQKSLRDRYYREGRNSKGQLMPKGWKPNPRRQEGLAKRYGKQSYVSKLTGKRREEYLAKQREYQRRLYAKQKGSRAGTAPTIVSEASPSPTVVSFCPKCGCNIRLVTAAIQFGDRQ